MSSLQVCPFQHIGAQFETPVTYPAEIFPDPTVKQVFYENVPYHGKTTRVFACYALPEGASAEHPVPGVVLVHGGGATALADWVRLWNSRGYAAISMDTCGKIPCWAPNPHYNSWPAHEFAGPHGWGRMEEAALPPQEQWPFHAVCAVIAGHSLLRSLPGVDPNRIGITGISWGGVLTCMAAGLDDRLRFAIPVYGCGFFHERSSGLCYESTTADSDLRDKWFSLWDPGLYLANAGMPTLFLSGTNDFAFPTDALKKSYDTVPAGMKRLALKVAYPHNHTECWTEETVFNFAESALSSAEVPALSPTRLDGNQLSCTFRTAGRKIRKAEFCYTRGEGYWADRRWNVLEAYRKDDVLSSQIPRDTTAAYFNIFDSEECCYSSEPLLLK